LKKCSVCTHPQRKFLVEQVLKGKMTIAEAAARMGVSKQTLWHHIQFHEKGEDVDRGSDLAAFLHTLVRMLRERLEQLLVTPVTPQNERTIVTVIKEMRELIMSVAKLQQIVVEQPTVIVQQKFQTALLTFLCDECKKKVLAYLEEST